jgi:hypothetical protein
MDKYNQEKKRLEFAGFGMARKIPGAGPLSMCPAQQENEKEGCGPPSTDHFSFEVPAGKRIP